MLRQCGSRTKKRMKKRSIVCLDLALGGIELDENDFAQDVPPGSLQHTGDQPTKSPQRFTPPRSAKAFKASSAARVSTRTSPRKKPDIPPARRMTHSSTDDGRGTSSTKGLTVSRNALTEIKHNMDSTSPKIRTSRKPSLAPKIATRVAARRRTTLSSKGQ